MDQKYTIIFHGPRKKMGLSRAEYEVIDTINNLSKLEKFDYKCILSNDDLSEMIDIGKTTISRAIQKGMKLGVIESGYKWKKTTDLWAEMTRFESTQNGLIEKTSKKSGTLFPVDNNSNVSHNKKRSTQNSLKINPKWNKDQPKKNDYSIIEKNNKKIKDSQRENDLKTLMEYKSKIERLLKINTTRKMTTSEKNDLDNLKDSHRKLLNILYPEKRFKIN